MIKYYENELDIPPKEDGILNIDVSFDGTWMTRGHRSKIGVAFVIECYTGTVIDFEVLSSYCHSCVLLDRKHSNKIISEQAYQAAKEKHKGVCKKNYQGSSGGMEKEAAVILWGRSLELKLRYTVMVSDGDTNTYDAIKSMNKKKGPYGLEYQVQKEECKNHLHKRMGNRLMGLKRSMREKKVVKGGKVQFRSTLEMSDNTIRALQKYYQSAIYRHIGGTWKDMKLDIMATFFHCTSTDENPKHGLCNVKWCLFKQDEQVIGPVRSHKSMDVYIRCSDKDVIQKVHDIYVDLSCQELLERCLRGKTQNPNESLHSKLWTKSSKTKFAGYDKVLFAAQVTVLQHNYGYEEGSALSLLGIPSSTHSQETEKLFEARRCRRTPPKRRKRDTKKGSAYFPGGF